MVEYISNYTTEEENNFFDEICDYLIFCNAALKILETELTLMLEEFNLAKEYNPIDHIKYRVKTIDSIVGKATRKNLKLTIEDIDRHMTDIVGARIVCPFLSDVYQVIELLRRNKKLTILQEQDYITKPKECGYASYHLLVIVPVNLSKGFREIKAEIQLRTLGMDFWATLEHKLNYKISNTINEDVIEKLHDYSKKILKIDTDMDNLAKCIIKSLKQ